MTFRCPVAEHQRNPRAQGYLKHPGTEGSPCQGLSAEVAAPASRLRSRNSVAQLKLRSTYSVVTERGGIVVVVASDGDI